MTPALTFRCCPQSTTIPFVRAQARFGLPTASKPIGRQPSPAQSGRDRPTSARRHNGSAAVLSDGCSGVATATIATLLVVALSSLGACTQDFDQFGSANPTGEVSATNSAGTSQGGSAGGAGGMAGKGGSSGIGGCAAGEKLCGASCVSMDDVSFGCADLACVPCAVANGSPACVSGSCAIGSCNPGFADCNGLYADGCEIDVLTHVEHCGACGRPCSPSHVASLNCSAGVCNSACDLGYANCLLSTAPKNDDGCELAVDNKNESCGSCNNSCSLQGGISDDFECDKGPASQKFCGCSGNNECRLAGTSGTCNSATGLCSCNGLVCRPSEVCLLVNGTDACSCNGGPACAVGESCCQTPAACKNLTTDSGNCGACGHVCPTGFTCVAAACKCVNAAECNAGTAGTFTCDGAGLCECNGQACLDGERCMPSGSCG